MREQAWLQRTIFCRNRKHVIGAHFRVFNGCNGETAKTTTREIDVVTTPDGMPVSMIHVNNFSSELDAWVKMFDEVAKLFGADVSKKRAV